MNEPEIQIYDAENLPSHARLIAVCDLFRNTLPVFDEQNIETNAETLKMRSTPEHYRALLDTKTLITVTDTRQRLADLLEWDPRDRDDIVIAHINWLLVEASMQGNGYSSMLHRMFEQVCIPDLMKRTSKTVYQALSVHLQNPAVNIYRKWGYSEEGAPQWNDGRLLCMMKEPQVMRD